MDDYLMKLQAESKLSNAARLGQVPSSSLAMGAPAAVASVADQPIMLAAGLGPMPTVPQGPPGGGGAGAGGAGGGAGGGGGGNNVQALAERLRLFKEGK